MPKNPKTKIKATLIVEPKKEPHKKGKPRGKQSEAFRQHAWKKGQSGNPSGRPKGSGTKLISEAYRIQLEQEVPPEIAEALGFESCTWAEAIAAGMARSAARGDTSAAKEVRESTEGKVPDHLRLSDPDGKPLSSVPPIINVNFKDAKDGKAKE